LILGENVKKMFLLAVAAAVSAIPEGLPIVVTITLAVGVSRMAARQAIVRKLPAVETLGSTTVICSDKTGTLTKNEMTVTMVYDGEQVYEISGSGYEPQGKIYLRGEAIDPATHDHLPMLFRIGLLCNESDIYEEEGRYKVDGDPTEGALIVSGLKAGLDREDERVQYPQKAIIPFESERGFMATLHEHQGQRLVFAKGAPEKLMELCTEYGTADRQDLAQAANNFARQGLRVLALAYKEVPPDQEELNHQDLETGLIFAGLQGMIDPPRPEAIEAVAGCRKAGIRVVMITGDHAITAVAISQELKIVERRPQARRENEIDDLSDAELFALLKEVAAVVAQQAGISDNAAKAGAGRRVRSLPEPELFDLIKKLTAALVKRTESEFDDPKVLTGKDLEGMTDDELFERLERVSVFARFPPTTSSASSSS
jgi:Ca2+-transporting ATPase